MELTIYEVIKGPVVSDKAYKLNKQFKKLMLKVHVDANKNIVKNALERLFGVKVSKVNILTRKGKSIKSGRMIVQKSDIKIAVITLAKGHSLDLFEQAGVRTTVESSKAEAV